ncbi:secreted frizzled-related protein 2-like [Brachyhypopomus gauderio]|uniref:secreted frizzled-related protein 2-like n=1 Tax=Brachyhypopomus gauderio TaxID=698409 RepID=UPI004042C999
MAPPIKSAKLHAFDVRTSLTGCGDARCGFSLGRCLDVFVGAEELCVWMCLVHRGVDMKRIQSKTSSDSVRSRTASACMVLLLLSNFVALNADDVKLDDLVAKVVSDYVTSTEFGSVRSVCKPVPNTMNLCHGIGYKDMRLPNLLGHDSAKEAQQQAGAWMPLVNKRCHRDTRKFLCSLFAPVCLPELTAPVPPCRTLCESVRDGCLPVMSAFGFPWPDTFNCSRFPVGAQLCIPGAGETSPVDITDTAKGTVVLCDACSTSSEGESAIQKDFCTSQFAFRLQIGSSSLEGTDLRLVPHGRSRVLRWKGEEHDQQAAMQQRELWLPEAANCSCQALEGQPAGSLLGLGHMLEGRMVLTRLIKWSGTEKELRKFIRKLTRQQC